MKNSYSSEVKKYLCERTCIEVGFAKGGKDKKMSKCCAEAFASGALLFSKKHRVGDVLTVDSEPFSELLTYIFMQYMHFSPKVEQKLYRGKERYDVTLEGKGSGEFFSRFAEVADLSDFISCPECTAYFLRGAFIACGTVTDPNKSYHLEFITSGEKIASSLFSLLLVEGKEARLIKRGNNHIVYLKGSERLSDFFTEIGAGRFALDIIEKSIEKEIKNNLNRSCNCENSNTRKTVEAFVEFNLAVEKIKDRGVWNTLPEELRRVAELRLKYPDASLSELCLLDDEVTLSRSGLNHRLKKITEIAKDIN
jgi:DNA-binding protein WhiA